MKFAVPLLIVLCLLTARPATGQAPSKERQFVYGINAFTWKGYVGAFSPSTAPVIYLLADQPSIVSPRETLVYFWPTTGDYRADWSGLDKSVPGMLELLGPGRPPVQLTRTTYVLQYPQGPGSSQSVLYVGAEAERHYQDFLNARAQFRDDLVRYQEARQRYQEALDQAVAAHQLGKKVMLPQPPVEPAPFLLASTELHDGFVLHLPVGHYRLRLRLADGRILPESERSLVVFTHRRESVGFTIVPQRRWTVPESADDPSAIVYARPDQVIYLQPFTEREYNDLMYSRLENPQNREGRPDAWRWEYLQPLRIARAEVVARGAAIETVTRRPFRVVQIPGEALGYEVVEHQGNERSDFEGFKVPIGKSGSVMRLLDAQGRPVAGSTRLIKVPRSGSSRQLFLIPLIPLTVGLGLVSWRREHFSRVSREKERKRV